MHVHDLKNFCVCVCVNVCVCMLRRSVYACVYECAYMLISVRMCACETLALATGPDHSYISRQANHCFHLSTESSADSKLLALAETFLCLRISHRSGQRAGQMGRGVRKWNSHMYTPYTLTTISEAACLVLNGRQRAGQRDWERYM